MVPQLHGKYAINLVKINPEKNTAIMDEQSNTQTEPFCVILTNFWAKKKFQKIWLCQCNPEKNAAVTGKK